MTQNNHEVRAETKRRGLRLWQVADSLGIQDSVFSRMLCYERDEDEGGLLKVPHSQNRAELEVIQRAAEKGGGIAIES